jgi:hypothetical protein
MAVGRAQVEELTTVLREMMTQMHDTAGLSVNRMAAILTTVVHDLSMRVTEMGEQMSQTVTTNAGQATQASQMIIGKVDQWSTHSTQQLAQLIDKHQAHLATTSPAPATSSCRLAHHPTGCGHGGTRNGRISCSVRTRLDK